MTARQMDALLDRLRVIRAFDITTVMSALVSYMDGVTEGVRLYIVQQSTVCARVFMLTDQASMLSNNTTRRCVVCWTGDTDGTPPVYKATIHGTPNYCCIHTVT